MVSLLLQLLILMSILLFVLGFQGEITTLENTADMLH